MQARDIIVIRACYMLGIWSTQPQSVPVVVLTGDAAAAASSAAPAGGVQALRRSGGHGVIAPAEDGSAPTPS
jgi:hypothetical protein